MRGRGGGGVGELEIKRTFEIAEEVLDRLPVNGAGVGVKASEDRDGMGDVWASGNGKVEESADSLHVGDLTHVVDLLLCLGRLSFGESVSNSHRD